jgi:predicted lipoprotein with Yx(FWY)xxD motif
VHHIRLSIAAVAVAATALAACGSSGSSSSYGGSQPAGGNTQSTASNAPASNVTATTAQTTLGRVLVDGHGLTLYGDTLDTNGMPTCAGSCASIWPPLLVPGASLPSGLDAKVFSVVTRPDGTHQLKAGKWPLYRFEGDTKPGQTTGQGSEGFFVVAPSGALVKTAA